MRDVQRGQVHQFKRAELEAGLVFQYAVNGGEIGNAFTHDAQRFGAVTAPGVVDDKARRVLRLHGGVTHLTGVLRQPLAAFGAGFQAADDFDHFHQRHRIEKMVAGKALRMLQAGGNRRD